MTEEFPSNSRTRRIVTEETRETRAPAKQEPKKIKQVTTSEVIRRKKPLGKRLTEAFLGGDAKSVTGYVLQDVLLPAAKDTIADAVTQGVERMIWGEARTPNRRGARPNPNYTPYNRFSSPPARREDPRREVSRRSRASHDFDEIILGTRVEAEAVINDLDQLIGQYGQATVSELYELVGISANFTDEKWGWTDLRSAGVSRLRSQGYLLDLPRPELLD